MKKILLILILILGLTIQSQAATGWLKTKPAGGDNPGTIDTSIGENNAALDLMLSTYSNCKITYTSATTISVSAGGVMVSNAAGTVRLMLANAAATSVTFTDIDTGTEEASTTYYVYAIGSATTDTTFTVKISKNSTTPTGVTYYALLGSFYNDASSNIDASTITYSIVPAQAGTSAIATHTIDTVYQNTKSKKIMVVALGTGGTNGSIAGYTGATSTPATLVAFQTGSYSHGGSITFVVPPNYYWKVTDYSSAVGVTRVESWEL